MKSDVALLKLIIEDQWMMSVLRAASALDLPDWMIGAGFIRNKVWDYLHGFENAMVPTADIDLIYFDPNDLSKATEKKYDALLQLKCNVNWSCKNQARMHLTNDRLLPYTSTYEALSEWVETATCIAVCLESRTDRLKLYAPHGLEDLYGLVVRPTPVFLNKLEVFHHRVESKKWLIKWPKLRVLLK